MGAVSAWLKVLVGFIIIAITFIYTQPLFDFFFAMGHAMGGNGTLLANRLTTALEYSPIMIAVSLILFGFYESTRTEDDKRY